MPKESPIEAYRKVASIILAHPGATNAFGPLPRSCREGYAVQFVAAGGRFAATVHVRWQVQSPGGDRTNAQHRIRVTASLSAGHDLKASEVHTIALLWARVSAAVSEAVAYCGDPWLYWEQPEMDAGPTHVEEGASEGERLAK